jgi:hypothetical protein
MRLDKVIEALRPFVDEGYPHVVSNADKLRAAGIVREYDRLPRAKNYDAGAAQPTTVVLGTNGRHVVLQSSGNEEVEPSYIVWSPAQAREIAEHLLRLAAHLEEGTRV